MKLIALSLQDLLAGEYAPPNVSADKALELIKQEGGTYFLQYNRLGRLIRLNKDIFWCVKRQSDEKVVRIVSQGDN